MFRLPETPSAFAIELVLGLIGGYVFTSFVELFLHKYFMHVKRLPALAYRVMPYLELLLRDHAVLHHGKYYREFDYEPDPAGKELNLEIRWFETWVIGAAFLPLVGPLFVFVSPVGTAALCVLAITHNRLWSIVHREMHIPDENAFFRDWAIYRFLARHHYLHHVHRLKNFNVVFPLADWVFGTVAKPAYADIREMVRLGYLFPRTARAKKRLASWRATVAQRRSPSLAGATGTEANVVLVA